MFIRWFIHVSITHHHCNHLLSTPVGIDIHRFYKRHVQNNQLFYSPFLVHHIQYLSNLLHNDKDHHHIFHDWNTILDRHLKNVFYCYFKTKYIYGYYINIYFLNNHFLDTHLYSHISQDNKTHVLNIHWGKSLKHLQLLQF